MRTLLPFIRTLASGSDQPLNGPIWGFSFQPVTLGKDANIQTIAAPSVNSACMPVFAFIPKMLVMALY